MLAPTKRFAQAEMGATTVEYGPAAVGIEIAAVLTIASHWSRLKPVFEKRRLVRYPSGLIP